MSFSSRDEVSTTTGISFRRLFAAERAKVVVADILAEDADLVAAAIRACGGDAFAAKIDVANEAEWVGAACAGRTAVWMRRRQPAAPNDHRLTLVVMPIPPRLGAHHMF